MPITSAKAEVERALREKRSVRDTYVKLDCDQLDFLKNDSYVSTEQIISINREWLHEDPIGHLPNDVLLQIDFQLIRTMGLQKAVQTIIEERIAQITFPSMLETAANQEE